MMTMRLKPFVNYLTMPNMNKLYKPSLLVEIDNQYYMPESLEAVTEWWLRNYPICVCKMANKPKEWLRVRKFMEKLYLDIRQIKRKKK
jgi:predicted patatin/cPLA2 family phospholipase